MLHMVKIVIDSKLMEDPKSAWQNLDHKICLGKLDLVGIMVTEENTCCWKKN